MWKWDAEPVQQKEIRGYESKAPEFLPPIRLTRRGRIVAFYLAPVVAGAVIYVAFLRDFTWT